MMTKYSTQVPGGLLQPLLISKAVWEEVSMDFIMGLSMSKEFMVIFVVVNRLTNSKAIAMNRMETNVNQKRREVKFSVGDKVMGKLHPYRQILVAKRLSNKLSKRFYGPFKVSERVRKKLEEFICCLFSLRRAILSSGRRPPVGSEVCYFEGSRLQWTNSSPENATWEGLCECKLAYPDFHLEDKVLFEVEGNDTQPARVGPRHTRRVSVAPKWQRDYVMDKA
ncbi:hypothetical protein Tco_0911576 [Tanacetum coccineum]|uniref:Reverse transcriptase n=1 Tax=Tanacetum coccineum TaxID=301880 RepID=A0ABQ5CW37_9ASTR